MVKKNMFTTENGLFCSICGNPAEYYSFRGSKTEEKGCINGYHCTNCDNENIIEDNMTAAEIHKYGFQLNRIVVYW